MERSDTGPRTGEDDLLRIEPVQTGSAVVLTAAGEVDLETGPRLRAALAELLERDQPVPIVVDLSDVSFLGSTGIAVLVDAHWQAEQAKVPFTLVVAPEGAVHRTLRATGVDHHLRLRHDVASALETD